MRNSVLKSFPVTFLTIIFTLPLAGQSDTTHNKINITTLSEKTSDHSLYTGAGGGSNMIFLGSTMSQNQPFGFASLTYGYKNALFASLSSFHLSGRSPFLAFISANLTYDKTFNKWFDISASISYYKSAPPLADTLFNSFAYGNVTIGFDWNVLYTKISAAGLIGGSNYAFLTLSNSRYFQTANFFNGKLNISFDPYFSILAGPLTKAETTGSSTVVTFPPFGKNHKGGSGATKYSTVYGFMNINLGVPVDLNSKRMTIELEPSYLHSFYSNIQYPRSKGFNFTVSLLFKIL